MSDEVIPAEGISEHFKDIHESDRESRIKQTQAKTDAIPKDSNKHFEYEHEQSLELEQEVSNLAVKPDNTMDPEDAQPFRPKAAKKQEKDEPKTTAGKFTEKGKESSLSDSQKSDRESVNYRQEETEEEEVEVAEPDLKSEIEHSKSAVKDEKKPLKATPVIRQLTSDGTYPSTFSHKTMIVIVSYHKNFAKREHQRNTWIKELPSNFDYRFIFGNPDSVTWAPGEQAKFEAELKNYGDMIIDVDIGEGYRRIAAKVFWALEWAAKLPQPPKYIIKTDDDIDPKVPMMLDLLESRPKNEKFAYYGYVYDDKVAMRDEKSQWYISYDNYPSDEKFPPYACGAWYFMTSDLALLVAEQYNKPDFPRKFPFEDILVGMAVNKAGYKPENNNDLFYCDRELSKDAEKEMFVHPAGTAAELDFKKKEE